VRQSALQDIDSAISEIDLRLLLLLQLNCHERHQLLEELNDKSICRALPRLVQVSAAL
jgi:hypothetical protein